MQIKKNHSWWSNVAQKRNTRFQKWFKESLFLFSQLTSLFLNMKIRIINITFKRKFLTNFMLFVTLSVRNKFAYQILHNVRNISSWDISQREKFFVPLFTRRYVKENWCFSTSTKKTNDFLLLLRPQLHLRTFQGIIITSKCLPVDPISTSDVWSTKILSVEIRMMTILIPPSAFMLHCTRTMINVIVLIFGGKPHFTVK